MRARVYLGGNNHDSGKRFPMESVAKCVQAAGVTAATFLEGHGMYKGRMEENWIIDLWDVAPDLVTTLCATLKVAFDQEAIGLEVSGGAELLN